jgi:AAA+ ATPase superfamily predicted ATPase
MIGRKLELEIFEKLYKSKDSKLVAVYGRRRVGKSYFITNFAKEKPFFLHFEGIEGKNKKTQIENVTKDLAKFLNDTQLAQTQFKSWGPVFDILTKTIQNNSGKTIIFLDEIQWIASGQSELIGLIKKYWDQHWKEKNVLLILCGSISSYVIKKVIHSKALYGRVDLEWCMIGLPPDESIRFFKDKRNFDEILKYHLVMGSIPRYLEVIELNRSFEQNMNTLFFKKESFLAKEFEKIFYSQFKEHETYKKITELLAKRPESLKDIAKKLKLTSGGGLKSYLDNLINAQFVIPITNVDKAINSKTKKYKVSDEYLRFYFAYLAKNQKAIVINSDSSKNLFLQVSKDNFNVYLGFAFEIFCLKNSLRIARALGFEAQVLSVGPYCARSPKGVQLDLVFLRSDKAITLCEIKYTQNEASYDVIFEMQNKAQAYPLPKGYTLEYCLISNQKIPKKIKESEFFHHLLEIEEIFK